MERKRKLPARAAARVEQASKKRMGRSGAATATPQRSPSPEPAPAPEPQPAALEELRPPLPTTVIAGQPLPIVDSPQPEDLSSKDYQSVSESGVLGEAITQSRQKWVGEHMFEKWWTKPMKRKGVTIEDPKNPPKHSMMKLGGVEISVGPHLLDATLFAIKDGPWIREPPPPPSGDPPFVHYGPPNGVLPPPPPPKQATPAPATPTEPVPTEPAPAANIAPAQDATPAAVSPQAHTQEPNTQALAQSLTQAPTPLPPQPQAPAQAPVPTPPPAQDVLGPPPPPEAVIPAPRSTMASPRGMESVLNTTNHPSPQVPSVSTQPVSTQTSKAAPLVSVPVAAPPPARAPAPPPTMPVARYEGPAAAPKSAPGTDPIILMLAEKAGEDPLLRDLMKRVAQGEASKPELAKFQSIIDAISAESKRKVVPVGPPADKLYADKERTVQYFADEVRAILDIVLSSNPSQTSADLRPPHGSDPLVVALVKAALDDAKTSGMVRRIASKKPYSSDAAELKGVLDRLRSGILNDTEQPRKPQPTQLAAIGTVVKTSGSVNGEAAPSPTAAPAAAAQQQPGAQQALRSKGPPKPQQPKSDVMGICVEFSAGSGDRFLFPKFSIVEEVPSPTGQQVVASFLIVRKGSTSEYPAADPELDYYQPVTIRIFARTGRFLDHLLRVVAPQEEVRRYMDDIMDNMTRAEYVLLAMRLPRAEGKDGDESQSEEKEKDKTSTANGTKQGETEPGVQKVAAPQQLPPSVLWETSKSSSKKAKKDASPPRKRPFAGFADDDDDQQYQSFVSSISRKEAKEV